MRRYGWSGQPTLSPFSSTHGQSGVPEIHDGDYDYITSDDLRRSNNNYGAAADDDDELTGIPRDDVLLLRRGNEVEKEYFPAYCIGDGKLYVRDVRERVEMLHRLDDDEMLDVRLWYKGKLLDDDAQPICRYGVKNNSELVVALPGDGPDIAYAQQHAPRSPVSSVFSNRSAKNRRPRSPKLSDGPSASTGNLDVPRGRGDRQGAPPSRAHSAASGVSRASGATGVSGTSVSLATIANLAPPKMIPGSPTEKLNTIYKYYADNLLPLCDEFLAHPPADAKKRLDEYRKISETTFQHVMLKLDEVETNGDMDIRTQRKKLVNDVQKKLNEMDAMVKAK